MGTLAGASSLGQWSYIMQDFIDSKGLKDSMLGLPDCRDPVYTLFLCGMASHVGSVTSLEILSDPSIDLEIVSGIEQESICS
jgi:hypothetical protein